MFLFSFFLSFLFFGKGGTRVPADYFTLNDPGRIFQTGFLDARARIEFLKVFRKKFAFLIDGSIDASRDPDTPRNETNAAATRVTRPGGGRARS